MYKCKKTLCLLIAAVLFLTALPASFSAAAEDVSAVAEAPLTVQVEMSKDVYPVTAKAKAMIRVKNISSEPLKDVAISAFSEKHLLRAGAESGLLIPMLESGRTEECAVEMVLDRKNARVSFIERVLLFFSQLFRKFEPMQGIPLPDSIDNTACTQEVSFRHGSTTAVLQVQVWYRAGTTGSVDPVDPVPRPQVTFLDKYVIDILDSGSYTVRMEINEDETSLPIAVFVDGDSRAFEFLIGGMTVQNLGLPASFSSMGKIRVILKDLDSEPKGYVAWAGGYAELEDIRDAAEMFRDSSGQDLRQQLQIDKLQYRGITAGIGYICETYLLPEENVQYNFYFSKTSDYEGIVRWDSIDLNTQETARIIIRLTNGVTDKNAFTVSGRKHDFPELEGLFGG